MSYPKRHPMSSQEKDKEQKLLLKKEQLKNLLINKFRGKYLGGGSMDEDQNDQIIISEVETFLKNEQMSEQNLVNLDKKLSSILNKNPSQNNQRLQSFNSRRGRENILKSGGIGQIKKMSLNHSTVIPQDQVNGLEGKSRGGVSQDIAKSSQQQSRFKHQQLLDNEYSSQKSYLSPQINFIQQNGNFQTNNRTLDDVNRTMILIPPSRSQLDSKEGSAIPKSNGIVQSAMRQNGQAILKSQQRDDDLWNKIIQHNVESFKQEQDLVRQKQKENQIKMKLELQQQQQLQRKMKQQEKEKEIEYMKQIQMLSEEETAKERQKEMLRKQKLQQEKYYRDQQLVQLNERKQNEIILEKTEAQYIKEKMKQQQYEEQQKLKQKQLEQKQICIKQFEENKKMKDYQRQKEQEELNQKPNGNDLFGELFKERKHQSYERREKNDKYIEQMKGKFFEEGGDLKQQYFNETQEKYFKLRNQQLQNQEDQKQKVLKRQELQTKMYLDQQIKEKEKQLLLKKSMENQEASKIMQDVIKYREEEKQKKDKIFQEKKHHKDDLQSQILNQSLNKKDVVGMQKSEFLLNKQLLDEIQTKSPSTLKKPF